MVEIRIAYIILIGKPEGRKSSWETYLKMGG